MSSRPEETVSSRPLQERAVLRDPAQLSSSDHGQQLCAHDQHAVADSDGESDSGFSMALGAADEAGWFSDTRADSDASEEADDGSESDEYTYPNVGSWDSE